MIRPKLKIQLVYTGNIKMIKTGRNLWGLSILRAQSNVSAVTAKGWGYPKNKFNFEPRYIEIDVLEKGKIAIAYYYLVGSYTINGTSKSDYRTRVSQILMKENGSWKIKSGHFTQLHGGSGVPN